jgi:hypothetical protein
MGAINLILKLVGGFVLAFIVFNATLAYLERSPHQRAMHGTMNRPSRSPKLHVHRPPGLS